MGCDIHLRLERKAKGQSKWQDCHIFGYDRCWDDRIYGMFAALADVRNYNDVIETDNKSIEITVSVEKGK